SLSASASLKAPFATALALEDERQATQNALSASLLETALPPLFATETAEENAAQAPQKNVTAESLMATALLPSPSATADVNAVAWQLPRQSLMMASPTA